MRVLAVSGSVRRDSYNTSLLRALAEEAPSGVDVELAVGHAHEKLDGHGELIDGTVRQGLRDALVAVAAEVDGAEQSLAA